MKKRKIIIFLVVFLLSFSKINYASDDKEQKTDTTYFKESEIDTIYNIYNNDENSNIKLLNNSIFLDLNTRFIADDGKLINDMELINESNSKQSLNLTYLLVDSYGSIKDKLSEGDLSIYKNTEKIMPKISISNEDVEKFSKEDIKKYKNNILSLDYKPENINLDDKIYVYSINQNIEDENINLINIDINKNIDNLLLHTFLTYEEDKEDYIFTGNSGNFYSLKKPIDKLNYQGHVLKVGDNNIETNNLGEKKNINIVLKEEVITLADMIDRLIDKDLNKSIFLKGLDTNFEDIKNKHNIQNFDTLYSEFLNEKNVIFLDYKIDFNEEETIKTSIKNTINKYGENNNVGIKVKFIVNPIDSWKEGEFNFRIAINKYKPFIQETNLELKEDREFNYVYESSNIPREDINITYGDNIKINNTKKGYLILVIVILFLSLGIYFIRKMYYKGIGK